MAHLLTALERRLRAFVRGWSASLVEGQSGEPSGGVAVSSKADDRRVIQLVCRERRADAGRVVRPPSYEPGDDPRLVSDRLSDPVLKRRQVTEIRDTAASRPIAANRSARSGSVEECEDQSTQTGVD